MFRYPDGPRKIAVAYAVTKFQAAPDGLSLNSYIWDLENPAVPETTIVPSASLVCLDYNPKVWCNDLSLALYFCLS